MTSQLSEFFNTVAIGNKSLPSGSPTDNETIIFDSISNLWKFQFPTGNIDLPKSLPEQNQTIVFDASTNKWTYQYAIANKNTIGQPTNNQTLVYNSATNKWTFQYPLANIDLPINPPTNNQTLVYNSATNKWTYQTTPTGFVDLTSNQTVGGTKTFSNTIVSNGLQIQPTKNLAINTSVGGPEIDMKQNTTSSASGLRIRNQTNTNFCQFYWDVDGFSLIRSDSGTPNLITTVANGRFTSLQDPQNDQDACTKNYVDITKPLIPLWPTNFDTNTPGSGQKISNVNDNCRGFDDEFQAFNTTNNCWTIDKFENGGAKSVLQIELPFAVTISLRCRVTLVGVNRESRQVNYDAYEVSVSENNEKYTVIVSETKPLSDIPVNIGSNNYNQEKIRFIRFTGLHIEGSSSDVVALKYFQIFNTETSM